MKNRSVLLVEDNSSDIALAQRAFAKSNVPVELTVVEDGQEALDYLSGSGKYAGRDANLLPALVLLDLQLPRIDGMEVLRQIRSNPHTSLLPVVILTTSGEEKDVTQSYNFGANSYIRKPVDFTQFSEFVKHLGLYWLVMNESSPSKG